MGSVRALSAGGNMTLFHLLLRHLLSIFCGRNQGGNINGQPLNTKRVWALVQTGFSGDGPEFGHRMFIRGQPL